MAKSPHTYQIRIYFFHSGRFHSRPQAYVSIRHDLCKNAESRAIFAVRLKKHIQQLIRNSLQLETVDRKPRGEKSYDVIASDIQNWPTTYIVNVRSADYNQLGFVPNWFCARLNQAICDLLLPHEPEHTNVHINIWTHLSRNCSS